MPSSSLTAGQFSNYTYTTTPQNFISGISETSDATAVYPPAGTQTASYNTLNQLTNLSGQALTFDAVGNVTSDGSRTYTWDAENRLVGITYPGVSGKATAFTYDGLSRRVAISSTPSGGGSPTVTAYLWCGDTICQARNASNTTIRSYYSEGELVPGTPNQPYYYYGIDQLGSVRRAFASTTSAPAYSYDPYGVPLQTTAPVTDFVYAGMFYNADSGLYLTDYRAYDPIAGRWLSRDPIGELTDPVASLYPYVAGDPIAKLDPKGLQLIPVPETLPPGGLACMYMGLCPLQAPADSCAKPNCPPGVICMTGNDGNGPTPRPDYPQQGGGRSGGRVKGLTGPPNSAIPGYPGAGVIVSSSLMRTVRSLRT